jgi:hypothetical protein
MDGYYVLAIHFNIFYNFSCNLIHLIFKNLNINHSQSLNNIFVYLNIFNFFTSLFSDFMRYYNIYEIRIRKLLNAYK